MRPHGSVFLRGGIESRPQSNDSFAIGPVESVLNPAASHLPRKLNTKLVLTPPSPTFYPLSELAIFMF